ncbi:unnamed protein product [Cuscuta epithymum]|uniref:Retrotransposon Copia-like N-terminal domain-containing protein n=1 Tax=Cuscuta epithymum TaxID=186058 RepID=A0AAV0EKA7_9ASTE|nr:unnamed protein product [Cuscuta epithymum]
MVITAETTVIPLTATANFPIKLTSSNFPVWKCQVQSALIGLGLEGYIDGTITPPSPFTDDLKTIPNPCYKIWYRQDKTLLSALLGSCSDTIQPLISSVTTARMAWEKLANTYASTSRGRIISLKTTLARTTKGNRAITDYLTEMYSIAEDLALAQCPVSDEDLVVSILNGLGADYRDLISAVRVRTASLPLTELQDILLEREKLLQDQQILDAPIIPTANFTQAAERTQDRRPAYGDRRGSQHRRGRGGHFMPSNRGAGTPLVCRFCDHSGHDVKHCRKLQRFLRDNHVPYPSNTAGPVAHHTSTVMSPNDQSWLFDSGASHHVASDASVLPTYTDYGGPEEVRLGDGSGHGGAAHARGEHA